MSEPGAGDRPGRCEVPGCGARSLFRAESRCFKHQPVTRIIIRLADGQIIGTLPAPPEPEAA